ncbi:MAG TPA: NAD-dependent epimerase/dehydratase family protein [Thermoanaerobaculia bacterium]|nr:NAD-dependent epimerase/dehydratase family protein [Thermoanaerobaculia bacterium]
MEVHPDTIAALVERSPVLVTGGAGYLGSALQDCLREHEISHRAVDIRTDEAAFRVDLLDAEATRRAFADVKPGIVVHCATGSALAYRDRLLETAQTDLTILRNVLATMPYRSRLVYLSSSYVYSGGTGTDALSEGTPLHPQHNFGVGKLFFEEVITRTHPQSVIFRLCSVFGPGRSSFPNAVTQFADEAREKGRIAIWGSGSRMTQYVHIDDVLRHVLGAARIPFGVYNLGGDDYLSVADTAAIIADAAGADVVYERDRAEGETLPFLDTRKLREASGEGFLPTRPAIRDYVTRVLSRVP